MQEPEHDPAERGRTPFAKFVQEQRQGSLHAELSDALAELAQAVLTLEKKGTLTLKLTATPSKDGATVILSDEVKTSIPQPARGAGIFFVDDIGNISRENPRQQRLPLVEAVDRRTGEIVDLPPREAVAGDE